MKNSEQIHFESETILIINVFNYFKFINIQWRIKIGKQKLKFQS